ncbi:MAG: class I SAM-dependent methyltransferase [Dysgonamonadaceae bacterium]|jgi:SAM-dependent methyltransferase|nr:class I SAM-dependent methyltransferase [Dysgonamonadaceae bacterium]
MYNFHFKVDWYFQMQKSNCNEYIIPFIEKVYNIKTEYRVLEIGCGAGGVITAFVEKGCQGVGVDIYDGKWVYADEKLPDYVDAGRLRFVQKDIYLADIESDLKGKFDVIILKDTIEHIHDQQRLINKIKNFLNPGGVVFFGFPPWQMPFGGHQQMCSSKILSYFPYFHLLPKSLYKSILNLFKEHITEALLEIKETGISIERFENIVKKEGYKIINKQLYFINPIYKYKFGIKVRKQPKIIGSIPYLRDFFTTSVYYLIQVI